MRIWVDGQAFQSPSKYRGIGRYIVELLKAIMEEYPETEMLISFNSTMIDEAIEAQDFVATFISAENIHFWEGVRNDGEGVEGYTDRIKLNERLLAFHVALLNPDIALTVSPFEGGNNNCMPLLGSFGHNYPICSIFYDAIPHRFPELYLASESALNYYQRRLHAHENFDHHLSISDFSDTEIRDILKLENSTPIYAGLSSQFLEPEKHHTKATEKQAKSNKYNKFILYVGELDWRKNVPIVVEAFKHCDRDIQNEIKFVIAGGNYQPAIAELRETWKEYNFIEENLVFTGYIDNDELLQLYHDAILVVQPSLMEGFGLTALEAVACGTPVLISNTGALPEVISCKDAQFSPTDPKKLAQLMTQTVRGSVFAKRILTESQTNLDRYTWEKSAKLAMGALLKLKDKFSYNEFDEAEIIKQVLKNIKGIKVQKEIVAEALAIAASSNLEQNKRLLIDTTSTSLLNHGTGIQRVIISTSENLDTDIRPIFANCKNDDGFHEVSLIKTKKKSEFKVLRPNKPNYISFNKNDVLFMFDCAWDHIPYSETKIKGAKLRRTIIISTLYDLLPLHMPGFCLTGVFETYCQWLRKSLYYSTGFVCISKAVADEFHDLLTAIEFPHPMKIGYWHLGADFSTKTKVSVQHHGAENRFLMVGTLEPRKGHSVALAAFEHLWTLGHNDILVIVGRLGWNIDSLAQKIECHPEFGKKLLWFKNASDYELAQQYELADVIICASYAEGFGLPIIEAAHYNKPVIASDIPVFHEVAYDNDVSYFDVGSSESLRRKIVDFEKQQKVELKDKKATYLSWKESTNQLCDVILEDDWYKIYTPKKQSSYNPASFEGFVQIKHLTNIKDKRHTLTLVDGPYQSTEEDKYELIVKVRNLSRSNWSSMAADAMGIGAINLACRQLSSNGQLVDYPGNRAAIPLTLIPNMNYYFSIHIPKEAYLAGGKFVVEFVQEGVSWWGNGLEIN